MMRQLAATNQDCFWQLMPSFERTDITRACLLRIKLLFRG